MSWAHKRTSQPPWGDNVGLSWGLDHCASLIGDGHHWPPSDDDLAIRVQSTHITTISLMIWPNIYLYRSLQRLRLQTRERSFNPADNYKHTHISLHTRPFVPLVSLLLYQALTQTKTLLIVLPIQFQRQIQEQSQRQIQTKLQKDLATW